jgi:hypothetical protein
VDALRHRALALSKGLPATPSNLARIAAATNDAAAKWAFGQWELRHRARHKFAQADQLFFTREALEQATHERVAQFHAHLFPERATVIDLTTGIGSDLMALATRGPVHGFEVDRERAELAAANLRALGLAGEIHIGNAMEMSSTEGIQYVFADPARRQAGTRVRDREDYQPDPKEVIERFAHVRIGGMKLSPLLPDSELRSLGPRVEFVSFGGECREALVMWGSEVEPAWGARNVETNEFLASESSSTPTVELPLTFIFDADPALVRAHATAALGLHLLGDSRGYLTGEHPTDSHWLRAYRVAYAGPGDTRQTQTALRALEGTIREVKQRGTHADGPTVLRRFKSFGARQLSLILYPVGRSIRHALVEPIRVMA